MKHVLLRKLRFRRNLNGLQILNDKNINKGIPLKVLFLLIVMFALSISTQAQRGVRIGYIDTEYILENVSEYQEAISLLDAKAQKWNIEIQTKLSTVEQKRNDLSNEKALLTKELIDERDEDLTFEEQEILDYQQKRFGPNGDLMIQKKQLMQPIQDQIFAAVQDLAGSRNYDFIFDKSADVIMLYSAKQFDLSEQILRTIKRTSKRTQLQTKEERKAAKNEDVIPVVNLELEEREKETELKQAERESAVEKARAERLAAREAKIKAAAERRQKIIDERAKAKQDNLEPETETETTKIEVAPSKIENKEEERKTRAQLIEENRQKKIKQREARIKALEEKKKKALEDRKNNN